MEIIIGITEKSGGFTQLLRQQKTPFTTENITKAPLILAEGALDESLISYINSGGMVILTDASPDILPFESDFRGRAVIEYADMSQIGEEKVRINCAVNLFYGVGDGEFTVHEDRVLKHGRRPGYYPIFLTKKIGEGMLCYSGMPLSELLTVFGDTKRVVNKFTDMTERITSVDKHMIERFLVFTIKNMLAKKDIPFIRLNYFPKGYTNVFAFRIDGDGLLGEKTENLSKVAKEHNMPLSFYLSRQLSGDEDIKTAFKIDEMHELCAHNDVHNMLDNLDENIESLEKMEEWLSYHNINIIKGFAAPRGMYNLNLGLALKEKGYLYTCDFGFAIDGLPFYPYHFGSQQGVLHLPVNGFNVERYSIYCKEVGKEMITEDEVVDYMIKIVDEYTKINQPILLFSHPAVFGDMIDKVFPRVISHIESLPIQKTTITQYAAFWERRDNVQYKAYLKDNKVDIIGEISVEFEIVIER